MFTSITHKLLNRRASYIDKFDDIDDLTPPAEEIVTKKAKKDKNVDVSLYDINWGEDVDSMLNLNKENEKTMKTTEQTFVKAREIPQLVPTTGTVFASKELKALSDSITISPPLPKSVTSETKAPISSTDLFFSKVRHNHIDVVQKGLQNEFDVNAR